MKKILSLVLAAMMIFSVLPAAFAAETAVAAEVSEDQVEAITLLNNLGIYKGYENGDMGADDLVQRYQMSIFATRFASGRTDDKIWVTTENDSGFTDIVDFAGAADYVTGMISYAAQRGIVNGTGDNKFEPTLYVKYKEAITMVVRALGQVYSAASYPWAYIQFANDNGLLYGIDTDIAPDDYVSRGVIAQLLYNALFVEIEGKTMAEKNFGVGAATVMVTASNNVVYEAGAATVLNTGKIRFAEIDAQGEPTGTDYHVNADLFGLENAQAADRAVGTYFNVYYIDNYVTILSAESLAVVYQNRGHDKMEVKASKTQNNIYTNDANYYGRNDYYVTVAGTKYQVVSEYTDLNRNQGATSNKAGSLEMKVFEPQGATLGENVLKAGYIESISPLGEKCIYKIGDNANVFAPYAYYSATLDLWYGIDANNKWVLIDPSEFYTTSSAYYIKGFKQLGIGLTLNDAAEIALGVSAYADLTVSANERMTVREYQLGQITYHTNNRVDQWGSEKSGLATFTLWRYEGSKTFNGDPANAMTADKTPYTLYAKDHEGVTDWGKRPIDTDEYFVDEYRWTGLSKSAIANGSYIIYYVNHETRELDVLEVIDASADGDDSYLVSGYIRGFDIATNSLTFGANYDTYYFNYDALLGSTIKSNSRDSSNHTSYAYTYLSGLYNVPVTLVIVDGKVAHIEKSGDYDYVIIDSFVSFEDDGVVANAWSTVDNGYTQIKIGSYNGWTVGGIDYWYYFMSSIAGLGTAANLPFTTKELYRVIDVENGIYDITEKGITIPGNGTADVHVNAYGYVENIYKTGARNEIVADQYVAASDSDYWMILDKSNPQDVKVYSLNGRINPITFLGAESNVQVATGTTDGADFYKAQGDYVIIVDNYDEMTNRSFLNGDIAYYMFNAKVNIYNNENYLVANTFNTYDYSLYMKNVLTGKTELVRLANDSIFGAGYSAYQLYSMLDEGAIYMAEDGVIVDATDEGKVELADVIADYITRDQYNDVTYGYAALTAADTAETLVNKISADMVTKLMTGATIGTYYKNNITVNYVKGTESATTSIATFTGAQAGLSYTDYTQYWNTTITGFNSDVANSANMFEAFWVIDKANGTATAWVYKTDLAFAKDMTVTLNKVYTGVAANGDVSSATEVTGKNPTFSAKLNETTGVLTLTIDATAYDYLWSGDNTVVAATLAGNIAGTLAGKTIGTDGYIDTLTITFAGVTATTAGTLNIQVQRNAADPTMSNLRFETTLG